MCCQRQNFPSQCHCHGFQICRSSATMCVRKVLGLVSWKICRRFTSMSTKRYSSVYLVTYMRSGESCGRTSFGCFTIKMGLPKVPQDSTIPAWQEHHPAEATSLLTSPGFLWALPFAQAVGRPLWGLVLMAWMGSKRLLQWSCMGSQKNPSRKALKHRREGYKSASDFSRITSKCLYFGF